MRIFNCMVLLLVIFSCWNSKNQTHSDDKKYTINVDLFPIKEKSDVSTESIELPNGEKINESSLESKGYFYYFKSIICYQENNKHSPSRLLSNQQLILFLTTNQDDWLFYTIPDLSETGWIYIFDIDKTSFYGDFEENEKSMNAYKETLKYEYQLTDGSDIYFRYGPMLLVKYKNNQIKLFDYFGGREKTFYNLLISRVDKKNLLLERFFYEGSSYYLFNMEIEKTSPPLHSKPVFNSSRKIFFTLFEMMDGGICISIFNNLNNEVKLEFEKSIFDYLSDDIKHDRLFFKANWLNDKLIELTIEPYFKYKFKFNDVEWETEELNLSPKKSLF